MSYCSLFCFKKVKLTEKQPNISKVFIAFLLVSAFIWLLINLSKEYTTTAIYTVSYGKLPQDKILQQNPIKKIDLLLKGNGFKLLSAKFSDRKLQLSTQNLLQKSATNYYILPNAQQREIQKQLASGLKLQQVLQDTIRLQLGTLESKKVPLISDINIQYSLGFNLAEKISISPDSVVISGAKEVLNTITKLSLEKLELANVSKNITKELAIQLPTEAGKVKISSPKARVKIIVDKFTEGEFEVPVLVTHKSEKINVTIFPKKVKVRFKIGLKNFNKVSESSFEVTCNYQQTKENGLSYLIPKVTSQPKVVSSVRIIPEKIDFLIHK